MNNRISLGDISAKLAIDLAGFTSIAVGTVYDRDYTTQYGKSSPQVWVAGQKLSPIDDGEGFSGHFRQYCHVDLAIRVMISRFPDGVANCEDQMIDLCNAVSHSLIGFTPTGFSKPFAWLSMMDGDSNQSIAYTDIVFRTMSVYTKAA